MSGRPPWRNERAILIFSCFIEDRETPWHTLIAGDPDIRLFYGGSGDSHCVHFEQLTLILKIYKAHPHLKQKLQYIYD